jgi:hypothetical protein
MLNEFEPTPTGRIASGFDRDPGYRAASPFLHIGRQFLPEMIREEHFHLKEVHPLRRGDEELARLEFDYRPARIENNPERGGWAVLDPARYWIVREFEVEGEWPDLYKDGKPTFLSKGTIAREVYSRESTAGWPIPVRSVYRQQGIGPTGPADLRATTEHEWREQQDIPEAEFALTAFGIPEPPTGAGDMSAGIDAPDRILANVIAGRAYEIECTVTNQSSKALRVIGTQHA